MNDERLSVLVSRHFDGQTTAQERRELEDILRGSAAARAQYWDEAKLHALVHEVEHGGVPSVAAAPERAGANRFAVATILALAACLAWFSLHTFWPAPAIPAPGTATVSTIAVLSRAVAAQWGEGTHAVGEELPAGWLHLRSGLVQVDCHDGVRLVLQGPLAVHLVSGREVVLAAGRLRAEVPRGAQGFVVRTPTLTVVDLGTEFGVQVAGADEEVHVFRGRVTVQATGGPPRELAAGQAMLVTGSGGSRISTADPARFPAAGELSGQAADTPDQARPSPQPAADRIAADPALLVHLDFAPGAPGDRTLRNRSARAAETGDAAIIGCVPGEGRREGRSALEFRTPGDRVRLRVPGTHRALTMIAWVRVDRLERAFSSLIMADGFAAGAVHWQIRGDGSLHLAIGAPAGAAPEQYNFDSPGTFTAARLGRWTQVAMVYDQAGWRLTQYADGEPIGRFPLTGDVALHLEQAELGNWNPAASADTSPVRNLTGLMDDFALFTRALTDAEILDLYRAGAAAAAGQQK